MAREFGVEGIRINCITPGLIETDITQGKLSPEKKKEIAELKKQRDALEDALRHAGGPAGWAR